MGSLATLGSTAIALAAAQAAAPEARQPPPWGAMMSTSKALEIAIGRVCVPAMLEGRSIKALALANHMVSTPPKSAQATPQSEVWRLAAPTAVYVVDWHDGSCTAFAERGDVGDLSAAVRGVIQARPEGLKAGLSEPVDNGRVMRTAYCTQGVEHPFVVTVTTARAGARRTRALSSTTFKARGSFPAFCRPGRAATQTAGPFSHGR